MAGFLSMLPNLVGGLGGSGLLDSIKTAAGNVLSDVGSGNVNSWGDFGKSLARAGAGILGVKKEIPVQDNNNSNADYVNRRMLEGNKNAANETTIIQQSKEMQPKGLELKPNGVYKPLDVTKEKTIQVAETNPIAPLMDRKMMKKKMMNKKKKMSKFKY